MQNRSIFFKWSLNLTAYAYVLNKTVKIKTNYIKIMTGMKTKTNTKNKMNKKKWNLNIYL